MLGLAGVQKDSLSPRLATKIFGLSILHFEHVDVQLQEGFIRLRMIP